MDRVRPVGPFSSMKAASSAAETFLCCSVSLLQLFFVAVCLCCNFFLLQCVFVATFFCCSVSLLQLFLLQCVCCNFFLLQCLFCNFFVAVCQQWRTFLFLAMPALLTGCCYCCCRRYYYRFYCFFTEVTQWLVALLL